MEIKKILFVTKFEEMCFDALQSILTLRSAALEHVVFLNVIERDQVTGYRVSGFRKKEEIRLRETANIRFIDWAEDLFEMGMEVGVYIVVGSLVPQVIRAAEREKADLIVIGRSHKTVFEQLYSGSDVTEILRRASIPVLVFKHVTDKINRVDKLFTRPLLATDWSSASIKAVAYLKKLKPLIEQVNVVNVVEEKELVSSSSIEVQKTRKNKRQKLEETCEELEAEGISAKHHFYIGNTEREIEKAAKECQASLIVMGSSSKPALMERWLGSTPLSVAEKTAFTTLIIPPGK